ncbi:ABC transporter ATP-binding protein [candidate division KSB1 bacterium]|nr:ABC transporter ATP-binding protein [candidate division KSB1 bacterium]
MITLKHVEFGYRNDQLLFKDLNLNIESGNIYGLLGPNGAGKTSLLKLLCGLRFQKSGRCEVLKLSPKSRPKVLFENLFYLPERTSSLSGSVSMYLKIYSPFYPKFDRDKFNDYLELYKINTNVNLSTFSTGQTRKFLLAFAIATNCQIILLDEPTNGLDIPGKSQFRKIVASALDQNKLFLIATHQVKDIETLVDHYIMIDNGKIVFDHSSDEIQNNLKFARVTKEPERDILYFERFPGGYRIVSSNEDDVESEIDIELLFNAVMKDAGKIDIHMKEEVTVENES